MSNRRKTAVKKPVSNSYGGRRVAGSYRQQRNRRKRKLQKAKQNAVMLCFLLVVILITFLLIFGIYSFFKEKIFDSGEKVRLQVNTEALAVDRPDIDVDLLTINKYSRPGIPLEEVNGIVIHYVGNPGSTAAQNRSYFENLKDTHANSASSHFIVGLDGEIVQCIPTSEMAYCSNQRNDDTIAIEVCHEKANGKFNEETYDSLVHLTAFLCCNYSLDIEDIIRHYDVTGKACPKYFVDHEDKWVQFKEDVAAFIEKHAYKK